jgi:hypothetical protein
MVTLNEYLLCPLMDDRSSSCYCWRASYFLLIIYPSSVTW